MKTDLLKNIFDSYINGQIKQMTRQISDYKDMYNVFEDLVNYLQSNGYDFRITNQHIVNIVIKYHRIKFR